MKALVIYRNKETHSISLEGETENEILQQVFEFEVEHEYNNQVTTVYLPKQTIYWRPDLAHYCFAKGRIKTSEFIKMCEVPEQDKSKGPVYCEKTGKNSVAIHCDNTIAKRVYEGIINIYAQYPTPCPSNWHEEKKNLVRLKNSIEEILPKETADFMV